MSSYHPQATPEFGGSRKTLCGYVVGFFLCALLTLLAFGLVQLKVMTGTRLFLALSLLALIQLLVQAKCFLGLNLSVEGRWNLLPFLFTALIIVILAGGSLWVMYNLNYNMMN